MAKLRIYSGRNRPDLTPVYCLFEQLTGTRVEVEKVYHHEVGARVVAERRDPQADLLLTNSQLAMEAVRTKGVFEPYDADVARDYAPWLRADDFSWLSFTAWPRVAMVNRVTLGDDPTRWPRHLESLTDGRFRDTVACASLVEMTTVAHFAALRVQRGDAFTRDLVSALRRNGLRVYESNKDTREALDRERLSVALANSSNVHVHYLAGHPVAEAWLDQGDGEMGTVIEAHTVAVLRGARHRAAAHAFIDFLLSVEIQGFLARLYGETPVNPAAEHGTVCPLASIRRMPAALADVLGMLPSTIELLRDEGFEVRPGD